MKRCLIIVAKQPVIGQVKTRIARHIGVEQATALYTCALEDTLELVTRYQASRPIINPVKDSDANPIVSPVISYAPPHAEAHRFFLELAPTFTLIPQHGADFGARLLSAFTQMAERDAERMVLIGTDNPSLPLSHIEGAFAQLDRPGTDAVLGRVSDGGYYLIGMRKPQPALFERITWSTEVVAAETHARAREANLHMVDVAPWYDLDTIDDLRTLLHDVKRSNDRRATRTRAFIESLDLEGASR